jgi:hypothetical protein
VLGEEFHPFDPNQGNYTIDGVLSTRVKGSTWRACSTTCPSSWRTGEAAAGGLEHDRRPRRSSSYASGPDVEARFDLLGAILKTNVDYDWEMHAGVRVHHRVYGTLGVIGGATLREVGTNGLGNRGTQTGGRGEGGFRVSGKAATIELYLAVERVIDPVSDRVRPATYASVGMRLLNR